MRRAGTLATNPSTIAEICKLVSDITGIQLGERQKVMVQSRLKKRLAELNLENEEEYLDYLNTNRATETENLVALLTTHHTYFFRESSHFDYLLDQALPVLIDKVRQRGDKTLRLWSAACSRGQEVYTISMLLATHLPRLAPDLTYEIIGTDVDSQSVAVARNGVYPYKDIKEIPASLAHGHWTRGSGDISDFVKARQSIKNPCQFETCNLLDFEGESLPASFDVIFCRNVFIYFTTAQVKEIASRLLKRLAPHGFLFIGISESLNGLDLPIDIKGSSIYTHKKEKKVTTKPATPARAPQPTRPAPLAPVTSIAKVASPPRVLPNPIRVLCVDDSNSVLMLLKQILNKDSGFEVVGTAMNGLDATTKQKAMNPDIMTLDIHMPEQDGLEYLKKNISPQHPPVVMISSAAREDGDLAIRCLESGAVDYVEKPNLQNLIDHGDEIRAKLRCALRNKLQHLRTGKIVSKLDQSFVSTFVIKEPQNSFRLIISGYADQAKLVAFFAELKGPQPPTLVLVHGGENVVPALVSKLGTRFGQSLVYADKKISPMAPGSIHLGDFKVLFDEAHRHFANRRTSILIYGDLAVAQERKVRQWSTAHILLEDVGQETKDRLSDLVDDIVPHTSFAYMSTLYLAKPNE